MSVAEFMRELSSSRPAPGGGAAAAISGALGASLITMACQLTQGKKQYAPVESLMGEVAAAAAAVKDRMLSLADQDAAVFTALMAAYKREDPAEKIPAVQVALAQAAEVPWQIALGCDEILALARRIAGKSNKNLDSDLQVALHLATAGLNSALVNVEINLALMEDTGRIKEKREAMEALKAGFQARNAEVTQLLLAR